MEGAFGEFLDTVAGSTLRNVAHITRDSIELQVAESQRVIDDCVRKLTEMREEIPDILQRAKIAMDNRDRLFGLIEKNELWRGDYESLEDYYDKKGFSRQRAKQLRDRIQITELINSMDSYLPAPSDTQTREMSKLRTDEEILAVWRKAVDESRGERPSNARVKELSAAASQGVNVTDAQALRAYEISAAQEEIRRLLRRIPKVIRHDFIKQLSSDDSD